MIETSVSDITEWCGGALITGVPSHTITSISTDSRSIASGETFLAIKGENFNGHDFLEKAIEAGAKSLIVSELPEPTESFSGDVIHCRNTIKSLQNIALHYRRRVIPTLPVIGITGSNGKTSAKDFLRSVLKKAGAVNATAGNLNNHIGLPLTVLNTGTEHRFGVWEMGMNHPGEIGPLAEIAAPNAAVVTNVGTAHIEHMKTREAIAEEKSRLPRAVSAHGFCVMPENDDFFNYVKEAITCEIIGVGGEKSEVRGEKITISPESASFDLVVDGESVPVVLPVTGRHMVTNALLAAAAGWRCGITADQISEGLSETEMSGGRLQRIDWNGVSILDDSYNANPDSMKAAISCLIETGGEGKKAAVLGFMGELGDHEETAHRETGEFAAKNGLDLLVTVSEKAALIADGAAGKIESQKFESHEEAAAYLKGHLQPGDSLLVKGSRAAKMEAVIEILTR